MHESAESNVRIGVGDVKLSAAFVMQWNIFDVVLKYKMLSYHRDRAAGCVSFGQKWKAGTGRQYSTDIIGLSSTTVI